MKNIVGILLALFSLGAQAQYSQRPIPSLSDLAGNLSVNQLNSGTGATSSTYWRGDGTWAAAGTGSVTSVSVTTANGVSGSVATSTTTPAITLTLGAITPSSVVSAGAVSDSLGDVRLIPQNSQSAAYTFALSDCGKHVLHPSADTTARTFTIDSNTNLALPLGCAITIVNQNAGGVITVAITSDTMRLAGAGTTGSRMMAANCIATVLKIVATEWIISGGSCLT